jgi:hypothetical protein
MSDCLEVGVINFDENGNAPFEGRSVYTDRNTVIHFLVKSGTALSLCEPFVMTNYPLSDQPFTRDRWNQLETSYVLYS